jgi:hypothetical protein
MSYINNERTKENNKERKEYAKSLQEGNGI